MQRLSHEMQMALISAAVGGHGATAINPLLSPTSPLTILPPPMVLPPVNHESLRGKPPIQEEPLSLVIEKSTEIKTESKISPLLDPKRRVTVRKGDHISRQKAGHITSTLKSVEQPLDIKGLTAIASPPVSPPASIAGDDKSKQRNYKNLTRARRVEANARERQRVHTITAAFDTLQAAIPTEEDGLVEDPVMFT